MAEIDDGLEEVEIFTDDEDNEYYVHRYVEIGDRKYAILVYIDEDEDAEAEGCGCGDAECGCDDEECEVEIARVETDEDGEAVFIFMDPDDPEYEKVCEAYEKLVESEPYEA